MKACVWQGVGGEAARRELQSGGRRREREGRERERESERERERERESERGAPSYEPSVQGHTKREKERDDGVPSYHSSVQGHTRQEKERERERCSQLRNKRPGTHQRGAGSREGGIITLRSRQVPMNLKPALTAVVTLCPAKMAGCFDRYGHVKA